MCLTLPYRIVTLLAGGRALADGPDGRRTVSLTLLEDAIPSDAVVAGDHAVVAGDHAVVAGDHVLVAYGSAIRRITEDEAEEILEALGILQDA
jgi:hydrogenase assembly chaperone HypC/HupF